MVWQWLTSWLGLGLWDSRRPAHYICRNENSCEGISESDSFPTADKRKACMTKFTHERAQAKTQAISYVPWGLYTGPFQGGGGFTAGLPSQFPDDVALAPAGGLFLPRWPRNEVLLLFLSVSDGMSGGQRSDEIA